MDSREARAPDEAGSRFQGYQLRVVQEVLLALLVSEASYGYQLRARLQLALGPLVEALNAGHVYVTLGRLEKAGLVRIKAPGGSANAERKQYELTEAGRERVLEWLGDTTWPRLAPAEFHLKLVAAAAARLADPIQLVDAQRHALLDELATVQRVALAAPDTSLPGLLLEGVALRLQADLNWLEACASYWASTKES